MQIKNEIIMEKEIPYSELLEKAEEKLILGNDLIKQLDDYNEIPGVQKVQRKIYQEIKFLQKVRRAN